MILIARTVSGSNSIPCYSRWLPSKDWEKLIGAHFRQHIIHLKKAARGKRTHLKAESYHKCMHILKEEGGFQWKSLLWEEGQSR